MKKILQINVASNFGSTGKIVKGIEKEIRNQGWESFVAYGRDSGQPDSEDIRIGNKIGNIFHVLYTRFTDKHGLCSKKATTDFLVKLDTIQPDIIHLHNIHGYYINYELLFTYIKKRNIPVVWTLHDCWSFTGHCVHFEYINCNKWKTECEKCPQINNYPKSFADNSKKNFLLKKVTFNMSEKLILVPVSQWLSDLVEKSFLKKNKSVVIYNGIDLQKFKIIDDFQDTLKKYNIQDCKYALAVASVWDFRKGLEEVYQLAELLSEDYKLVIVGLTQEQIKKLPKKIIGLQRTDNVEELVALYNGAQVFVNPTLEDTFPTTNLEAMACGTPVVTYKTGGSPESIDHKTGEVVEKKDIYSLLRATEKYLKNNKDASRQNCRSKAEELFNRDINFKEYINLYKQLFEKKI
ncbi:Glycosyltransferase involved in cell wall bisynthesis [Chryseobacterium arachidis]|uniref:Glycosyltransferase involved in cell wall bisynthesis n=1 Tax=Chryseobacterium arachidis TaxID=1416778 RepID=A0A1M5M8H3_9FLAO|nr:glycosyltransferase [Chryseobacterium arachidis]SHG73528.1 Glycosyltransferase involved in cell wall bisynthesis [Chryseobacterium arachidis]